MLLRQATRTANIKAPPKRKEISDSWLRAKTSSRGCDQVDCLNARRITVKFKTPEKDFKVKKICVTGKITAYDGLPEIVADDPRLIRID